MKKLNERWLNEPLYIEALSRKLNPDDSEPLQIRRAWWASFPKVNHYALESEAFDFRAICIDRLQLDNASFAGSCMDYSSARYCTFDKTYFQDAAARHADFTGSRFICPQMSRIFAQGAVFRDCIFEGGFLMGSHARHLKNHLGEPLLGGFSDLRDCDFSGATLTDVALDNCDFRGAKLNGARFIDCNFRQSDLQGVDLRGAFFERCNFERTLIDDSPEARRIDAGHGNTNADSVVWCGGSPSSMPM